VFWTKNLNVWYICLVLENSYLGYQNNIQISQS